VDGQCIQMLRFEGSSFHQRGAGVNLPGKSGLVKKHDKVLSGGKSSLRGELGDGGGFGLLDVKVPSRLENGVVDWGPNDPR